MPGAFSTRARPLALESPTTSPLQPAGRHCALGAAPPPAPPRPAPGAARPAWETRSGVRNRDAHRSAGSWDGRGWHPGLGSLTLGERRGREECGERGEGRIPGARGRTGRQEVPCDANLSGANAPVGAGALDLGPSYPRTEGALLSPPPPPSSARRGPSRAASSRARQLQSLRDRKRSRRAVLPGGDPHLRPPAPHPHPRLSTPAQSGPALAPRGVHSLAWPPLVPAASAWARRPALALLRRPAPALPGFLFNNIAREAPAERTRQNFLPGRGRAAAARDNPRCPGFLSPPGRASALGTEAPPPPPALPGIRGRTWPSPGRWRQQDQDRRTRG